MILSLNLVPRLCHGHPNNTVLHAQARSYIHDLALVNKIKPLDSYMGTIFTEFVGSQTLLKTHGIFAVANQKIPFLTRQNQVILSPMSGIEMTGTKELAGDFLNGNGSKQYEGIALCLLNSTHINFLTNCKKK